MSRNAVIGGKTYRGWKFSYSFDLPGGEIESVMAASDLIENEELRMQNAELSSGSLSGKNT